MLGDDVEANLALALEVKRALLATAGAIAHEALRGTA